MVRLLGQNKAMSSLVNVAFHPSQSPAAVRRALVESLRSRKVNHKFHYDSFKQAQKWLALHQAWSPSRTDPDCGEIYDRGLVEKEEGSVIIASFGTFSTGINIKNLHNIVFASPTKSQVRVLQSIGRGLRKTKDERSTTVYDIADDLSRKGQKNYTLTHGIERAKIYTKEKFDFEVHEVPIS